MPKGYGYKATNTVKKPKKDKKKPKKDKKR